MRGASALIMADHLNRFSNGSSSLIRVVSRLTRPLARPRSGLSLCILTPHVTLQVTSGGILLLSDFLGRNI